MGAVIMSNTIDCTRVSHAACFEDIHAGSAPPAAADAREAPGTSVHDDASYECVNDCVSSLGVPLLLSGAVSTLGCALVPPACSVFASVTAGATLGACEAACADLQRKPSAN
jgi:hypothetical protein